MYPHEHMMSFGANCQWQFCLHRPSHLISSHYITLQLSIWGAFHTITFTIVTILAVASHFKAMTTDPGAIPPDAEPLPVDGLDATHRGSNGNGGGSGEMEALTLTPKPRPPKRICRRCKAFKPDRSHHCSICKRCIMKMDHHCP